MVLNNKHIMPSKQKDGKIYSAYQVYYFNRGRSKDPISCGYIEIELVNYDSSGHQQYFQSKYGILYDLAPISTNITDRFHSDWEAQITLPDFKPVKRN